MAKVVPSTARASIGSAERADPGYDADPSTDGPQTLLDAFFETTITKTTAVWLCAATAGLTMAAGLLFGGWLTRDDAHRLATSAANDARTTLVTNLCVEKFASNEGFANNLQNLKKVSLQTQGEYIAKGGWATFAGMTEPSGPAAHACAERLRQMQPPAPKASLAPAAGPMRTGA